MALRKDGNSKSSASYMPYDSSNSLVKKMANKVTGLIGWRSQSQSSVISQNYDNLSSSTDEDSILPTPKRIRVQNKEEDTLLRLIPSTSKAINEVCSPIQPINDIRTVTANNRNKCLVSSTPADIFSSTSNQVNPNHQTHNSNVTDSFDNNESVNSSMTIYQSNIHQRHNVTVPAISKDIPNQVLNLDTSTRGGSFSTTNSRRPSFNVDVFSNSSRRLSMSVCENRNVSSLSPFYSARTMYGGASALLPYGNPSVNRIRSASTSRLNLFTPRSQITIQPISPSPNKSNDQETMSAAARKILDTLEKYCSPVMDAKRIPVNEMKKTGKGGLSSQLTPSKGVKRKLPSLNQVTPSTTDLLRIKRQEKIQDSVSSARQVVSTVLESTIAAEDTDSSCDSADLDYSILKTDTKTTSSQKYIGKIRRKDDNKLDNNILPPLKLPNAILKITNLPKFNITDTFKFSKPLLLENLDQSGVEESSNDPVTVENTTKRDQTSQSLTKSTAKNISVISKTNEPPLSNFPHLSKSPSINQGEKNLDAVNPSPQFLVNSPTSKSNLVFPKLPVSSSKTITPPWTCKVCLLESTDERCSSCTSSREENKKPPELPKPPPKIETALSTTSSTSLSSWGDKFKPASDTWECKECFVRSPNTENKCVACASPKPGASIPTTASTTSNELWKNLQNPLTVKESITLTGSVEKITETEKPKFLFGIDKVDGVSTSSTNSIKFGADSKISAGISFVSSTTSSVTGATISTKPNYTFGFGNALSSSNTISTTVSSNDNTITSTAPTFSFGDSNAKTVPAITTTSQFSFGMKKVSDTVETTTCNALGMKSTLVDRLSSGKNETGKIAEAGKSSSIFNEVSGVTNTKNPLLKSMTSSETTSTIFNDEGPFKSPKSGSLFENASANKENGDDKGASNSVFNSVAPSNTDPPPKKKNVLFPSFGSVTGTPNMFGSNGFAKLDTSSQLTNSSSSAMVSSSATNVFSSSFSSPAPSKLTNDIQVDPTSFAAVPNTEDSVNANDDNKGTKLFANTNSFGVSSSTQQQQPLTNSVFGNFGGTKPESQTTSGATFNTTPMFSFGNSNSVASQPAPVDPQPASGGFSFNGPKANDTSSKFVFGGMTNSSSNTNSTFGNVGAPRFSFNSAVANDQSKPAMNSIFATANVMKGTQPEVQANSNSLPTFGNNIFCGMSQPQSQISQAVNTSKKPGGFSFPTPNQFGSQPVNNFSSFGNTTAENQDQSRLHGNATSAVSPYVFGSANLTVPQTFNFTGGTALTSFSAQPTTNNTTSTGVVARRIKKAVRRTAK